jgi:hypothetical protein
LASILGGLIWIRRNPRTDKEVLGALFNFADLDDAAAVARAETDEGLGDSARVITGTVPSLRLHLYWERETAARNLAAWTEQQRAVAAALSGDAVVIDPRRIMRLPGTVSYPTPDKVARGYVPGHVVPRWRKESAPVADEWLAVKFPAPSTKWKNKGLSEEHKGVNVDEMLAAVRAGTERWHNGVLRLVGHCVSCGWPNEAILALSQTLTLTVLRNSATGAPYTIADTRAELVKMIEGARRKGWAPPTSDGDPNGDGGAWDEPPVPLIRPAPPGGAFPIDALGPILAPAASAIMDKTQAPDALCASSVLAAASLCAQAHADIVLPTGQIRPLSGFFLTVGESGERKTAVDEHALAAVRRFEAELRNGYKAKRLRYLTELDAWEATRAHVRDAGKKKSGGKFEDIAAAMERVGPPPVEPVPPLMIASEPTYEGLFRLSEKGLPSLGIFSNEAGLFVGGHAMRKEAQLATAAGLSELWDGGLLKRVRVGEHLVLPGRRASLHLMAQPVVADIFCNELLRGQGLLSRVLMAWPASTMGSRLTRPGDPRSAIALGRYEDCLYRLLDCAWPLAAEKDAGGLLPRTLVLEPEAVELWVSFADEVESQLGKNGKLRPISGLANKLPEIAARLAGVLTIVESPKAGVVSAEDMARGIALAVFYANEGLRLAEVGFVPEELKLAQKLLDWLHEREIAVISAERLYHYGPNSIRSKAALDRLIEVLVRHGWLGKVKKGTVVDGKPRTEAWWVR